MTVYKIGYMIYSYQTIIKKIIENNIKKLMQ